MISIVKNIGVLRGLAILIVVFAHAEHKVVDIRGLPALVGVPYSAFDYAMAIISATLGALPVPAFMVASGFFMARFTNTWPVARASAQTLATRYALWSIAGYVLLTAMHPTKWRSLAVYTLEQLGPFPAYWFLAVLVFALLVSPWLTHWARSSPRSFIAGALALEIARGVVYNLRTSYYRVVPLELPFFMLGILLSQHTDATVKTLAKHRQLFGYCSLIGFFVEILESLDWWRASGGPTLSVFTDARPSMRVWSVFFMSWFLLAPSKSKTKISKFLYDVGVKSLAILLSFDLIIKAVTMVFWHLPMLTGGWNPAKRAPPFWMGTGLFAFVLFAASCGGSLIAVWGVERVFGSRWRRVIFG